MRILLVANGYPPSANGGVETYTYNLANMLVEGGHEVHVLCKHSDFARPDNELQEDVVGRVHVTRIVNDFKQIENFEQTYRSPKIEELFRRSLMEKQRDLVHYNHLVGLSCQLPAISASAGIPAIFMIHDF